MEYLYRAITKDDLKKYENKQDIEAPAAINNFIMYPTFESYLYDISTHILSGDTKTMWISLSKDFNVCYKKYSNNGNHDCNVRNNVIAVKYDDNFSLKYDGQDENIIKDFFNSVINTDHEKYNKLLNIIYGLDPNKIDKVVLDISKPGSLQVLTNINLIKSRNKKNPNYGYTATNYASSDKEVLMFKNIKYEDIAYILTPLEMDLLYAISIIEDNDYQTDIEKIFEIKDFLDKYLKCFEHITYFDLLYKRNLTVTGCFDSYKYCCSNYKALKEYIENKRRILKIIIYSYYLRYKKSIDLYYKFASKQVPIIEDEYKIYDTSLKNYDKARKEFDEYLMSLIEISESNKSKGLI